MPRAYFGMPSQSGDIYWVVDEWKIQFQKVGGVEATIIGTSIQIGRHPRVLQDFQ
jgi:hypothetical protein